MRILMVFLDGVGIGKHDPEINPFFATDLPALRSLFNGELPSLRHQHFSSRTATLVPLDANLGVEGLPQSGTGQTALFTGVNGARVIGKHFGPHPYSTLKPIIQEKNIFRTLKASGKTVCFANAYPQKFFDYAEQRRSRLSVTTSSCMMSDVRLLRAEDLCEGRGVSADITNAGWPALGYPNIPPIEPAEAGRRLARLSVRHDFVLFEYWMTDHAGHSQNMAYATEVLRTMDAMLVGLIETLDAGQTLLLLTSDHGNIEDMSTKAHTRNPVPAILYGQRHREIGNRLRPPAARTGRLTRVSPTLVEALTSS